jgi:hypothetical protein
MATGTLGRGLEALRDVLRRRADAVSWVLITLFFALAFGPTAMPFVSLTTLASSSLRFSEPKIRACSRTTR